MRRKIFKIIKWLAIVILILCCMGITWNYFCKKREIPKIQAAYGNAVKVNGKKMTVEIAGLQAEESPVIVLLPGLGSPSPVLEFRPLAEKLGKTYKVITVEPFGYGLSDPADTERSIENIVEELHACLEEIGVHRYYLMAHSISGLYSLYYANTYPEEVRGFIGIDSSVPKQNENEPFDTTKLNLLMAYLSKTKNVLGISRIFSIGNPEKAIYADQNYSYSQEDLICLFVCMSIAIYLHTIPEFLVSTGVFMFLRTYAGGVHLNSFKACFTCSVAVQVMILQINNKYPLGLFVAWGIILVSSICIWKLSPVENINHELEREEKEHCRKVTGKILGVILIAAGCCTTLGMKKYISLIALTALTVFISQCIGIIKYKVEKEKN